MNTETIREWAIENQMLYRWSSPPLPITAIPITEVFSENNILSDLKYFKSITESNMTDIELMWPMPKKDELVAVVNVIGGINEECR